jgi:diguanylate cyclase (GGDEF)-like protein/PAS domain S-box-containing protein
MPTPLRVLLLEHQPADAELVIRHLRSAGFEPFWHRVETEKEYLENLSPELDIILADYSLPRFDSLRALSTLREKKLDTPFVIITSSINEEIAVECIKQGASDYLLKDRLSRLGHAVERALREKGLRDGKRQAEEALRESEERYARTARGTNDGLWDWDLVTGKVYYSPRWKAMLGFAEDEIPGVAEEWLGRLNPNEKALIEQEIERHIRELSPHFELEYRLLHKDGKYRWMLCRGMVASDAMGAPLRVSGSQTDITKQKETEEQLLHDALHDAVTGLPNRALFMDRLGQALERTKRHKRHLFAVILLDLDRFKVVNDSLGSMLGDQLLKEMGRRLETCIRTVDTVARLGGDEFTLLLGDIKEASDAIRTAERIQEKLSAPFNLGGNEVFVTASIGIAPSVMGYERPEHLLRDAGIAMHRAKSRGKACHQVFDVVMHEHAVAQLRLETDLRRAVETQSFGVHYQPIVSMATGRLAGFEALVRWQHPERGLLFPDEFIAVAEETGLIIGLDRCVLRAACRQMRVWQDLFPNRPPLTISVNLSAKQFAQPDVVEHVKQVLTETGLSPGSLKLEITETVIMSSIDNVTSVLKELRELGVEIHLDDFGTGYSSLSYLHRFPIDVLKIDRSFVRRMGANGKNSEIAMTIITLAHNMGMAVVAEGVETEEQLRQLKSLGCEFAQGFFYSEAVDYLAAENMIHSPLGGAALPSRTVESIGDHRRTAAQGARPNSRAKSRLALRAARSSGQL